MNIHQFEPFFGSWYVDEQIGQGSQSTVYKIHNERESAAFRATHVIFPEAVEADETIIEKYINRRANKARELFDTVSSNFKNHPNIVQHIKMQIDIREWDAYIFEILELLEPIKNKLINGMSERDIVNLGIDTCSALEACHEKGIIHRDVKPSNLYFDGKHYKLGDFSIATRTPVPGIAGSFPTIAPEVLKGAQYDSRADIYSLGMTLYILLNNGELPLKEGIEQFAWERATGKELPRISGVSAEIMDVVKKSCMTHPDNRYQTAAEFEEALKAVLSIASEEVVFRNQDIINGESSRINRGSIFNDQQLVGGVTLNGEQAPYGTILSGGRKQYNLKAVQAGNMYKPTRRRRMQNVSQKDNDIFQLHRNFISWVFFTCGVSIIPIVLYLTCAIFIKESKIEQIVFIHEIIFFTIVVLTNMMKTLFFGNGRKKQRTLFFWFSVLGIVLSVLAFGMFTVLIVSETVGGITIEDWLIWAAVPVCVGSLIMAGLAENMEDKAI